MSKKNLPINTGFAHIEILFVILAIVVLGISVFFVQKNSWSLSPEIIPDPKLQNNQETYVNEDLQFSVKYSSNEELYILDEDDLGQDDDHILYLRPTPKTQPNTYVWALRVYPFSLEDVLDMIKNPEISPHDPPCEPNTQTENDVAFGDKNGVELIVSCYEGSTDVMVDAVYWFFEHEGNTFVFIHNPKVGSKDLTFDQILSTFRFSEPSETSVEGDEFIEE